MIKINEAKVGDKFIDMIGREWTCSSIHSESNSKAFVDADCIMLAKDDAEAIIKWFTDHISAVTNYLKAHGVDTTNSDYTPIIFGMMLVLHSSDSSIISMEIDTIFRPIMEYTIESRKSNERESFRYPRFPHS